MFSSAFLSPLHKSLSPLFLFSVKLPRHVVSLFQCQRLLWSLHVWAVLLQQSFLWSFGGEQVRSWTVGVKHQGRRVAVGQSAAKWCCRYREARMSWISWAPRYTLKPGQSQRHWDSAAKSRTSVIKRKALSLSGFQRLSNRDAWGMKTSFFGCKFVSFPLGMTSEIFQALMWRKFSKKKKGEEKKIKFSLNGLYELK